MIASLLLAVAFQQGPVSLPSFASWDGKSWAGIALGTPEKDLKKQVRTGKTVGPDPASIRITVDKKGWIVAGLLTDVRERGSLAGFTIDLERDEPIESLEALQQELGAPDFTAYPRVRYSDWSLAVWKDKGIAAVIRGASRPLVQKILLAAPAALSQNLDVWDRDPNRVRETPLVPVSGFDVSVTSNPNNNALESASRESISWGARRLMSDYNGRGWEPARGSGTRLHVSLGIRGKGDYSLDESVSLSYQDELGDISITQSTVETVKKDIEVASRARTMFETLMAGLPRSIEEKYRRLTWQAEWRPFTALAKPKA